MIEIDATDARLLDLMQQDASLSNQALADAAHVSPATALRRIKRMVDGGLIEKQTALLALEATGGLNAIVEITLDRQGDEHAKLFEAVAVADEAVQQCYRVAAGPDFVLMLWVRDMPFSISAAVLVTSKSTTSKQTTPSTSATVNVAVWLA